MGPNWVTREFAFDLDLISPYVIPYAGNYKPSKPVDENGVVITEYKGERVYHPVDACWYLLPQLRSFELDSSTERYASVIATTQYLLDGSETHRIPDQAGDDPADAPESLWFPYHFAHTPGGLNNGLPWYSGMAQGMMLSHLVRLHEVTGEEKWRDLADAVFNSFRHYRNGAENNDNPWFVCFMDEANRRLTYFEEYPSTGAGQLSHVVNGNMYAMWGVYDYLRISDDKYARTILCRALATLLETFPQYRAPDNPSMYGATPWSHLTWKNPENYHMGVISQLRRTAELSGDDEFARHADMLEQDIQAYSASTSGEDG